MRTKRYPSDISREQFGPILPLEQARRKTKPRTVDLYEYEVFCAVLYLLRTGCQRQTLPSDFPKWRTVHSYFAKWREPGQDGAARERQGRHASSTLLIYEIFYPFVQNHPRLARAEAAANTVI